MWVLGLRSARLRTIQPTATWWYILVVAESNGLNLRLGVNSHTQRSLPHTHTRARSRVQHRETDSAAGLPEDNLKVGFEVSRRAEQRGDALLCANRGKNKRNRRVSPLKEKHHQEKKRLFFTGERTHRGEDATPGGRLNAARGGGESRSRTLKRFIFMRDR